MSGFAVATPAPAPGVGTTVSPAELEDTGVTPGAYTYMGGTVDADGRLSAAASGTTPYVPGGTDVAMADGGTGASTAANARTNLGFLSAVTTAAFPKSNTTLANITGLSLTVGVGTWEVFALARATIPGTGGIKFALAGTATVTALNGSFFYHDGTAFGGCGAVNVAGVEFLDSSTSNEVATVYTNATITVSVAGTLTLQFAESSTDAVDPSAVSVGSTLTARQLS